MYNIITSMFQKNYRLRELINEVQNALSKKKSSHCGWGLSAGQKDVCGVLIFSLHTYYIHTSQWVRQLQKRNFGSWILLS